MIYDNLEQEANRLIYKEATEGRMGSGHILRYGIEIRLTSMCRRADSWRLQRALPVAVRGFSVDGKPIEVRVKPSPEMQPHQKRAAIWYTTWDRIYQKGKETNVEYRSKHGKVIAKWIPLDDSYPHNSRHGTQLRDGSSTKKAGERLVGTRAK